MQFVEHSNEKLLFMKPESFGNNANNNNNNNKLVVGEGIKAPSSPSCRINGGSNLISLLEVAENYKEN